MPEVQNIFSEYGDAYESSQPMTIQQRKLNMDGPSEATLTLEDKAESIPMHGWVKMYNQLGFVGIFRRISRNRTIATDNIYNLKHGIDILQDSIWDEETTFTGTKTEFLTAILNKQTQLINGVKPWTLGSCADTSTVKKDISYDNLLDLFTGAAEQGGDYYFTYDQSSFPWTVSLVAKPSAVASEFRMNRNIERCRINDNDSELCTRLILNVNKMVKDTSLSNLTGDRNQVLTFLGLIGVIVDPTTAGIGDSERALQYEEPWVDK